MLVIRNKAVSTFVYPNDDTVVLLAYKAGVRTPGIEVIDKWARD